MIIPFSYSKWSPPKLQPDEQARIGAEILTHGKQRWFDEFDRKSKKGGFAEEPLIVKVVIAGLLILVAVFFLPLLALAPVWLAIYLGSAAIARNRFSRWLDKCVAAHHATQQMGSPQPSRSIQTQPLDAFDVQPLPTTRTFSCVQCHQPLRVPLGAGRISARCPQCKTQQVFDTNQSAYAA